MSIYFDFKTINELIGDNHYRNLKEFTLEDLSQYDGFDGSPAYVAIYGIVYDISSTELRNENTNIKCLAGKNLTNDSNSCDKIINDIINHAPSVGVLI